MLDKNSDKSTECVTVHEQNETVQMFVIQNIHNHSLEFTPFN